MNLHHKPVFNLAVCPSKCVCPKCGAELYIDGKAHYCTECEQLRLAADSCQFKKG